jgi:hypothetical protein
MWEIDEKAKIFFKEEVDRPPIIPTTAEKIVSTKRG